MIGVKNQFISFPVLILESWFLILNSSFFLNRQLSAGCVYILAPAPAQAYVYPVSGKMLHKFIDLLLFRLFKLRSVYGVVFYNVDEVCRYSAVYFYQIVRIFDAIIKIFEQDVFKSDLVACRFIEIIQRFYQRFDGFSRNTARLRDSAEPGEADGVRYGYERFREISIDDVGPETSLEALLEIGMDRAGGLRCKPGLVTDGLEDLAATYSPVP